MATIEKTQGTDYWSGHIQQWQLSGSSQAAYCRLHDLRPKKFNYWKRKLISNEIQSNASHGFSRVQVADNALPVEILGLTLRFNDGTRLEGITQDNMQFVQPLLEVLR